MIFRKAKVLGAAVLMTACNSDMSHSTPTSQAFNGELIVLAAPQSGDDYYAAFESEIIEFQINFAASVAEGDAAVILSGAEFYDRYAKALGKDRVILAEQRDIWIRDFAPLNPSQPVMMRYSAAGQGGGRGAQRDADFVQDGLFDWMTSLSMSPTSSDWISDGGNFVLDEARNAVLSRKFLRDNRLSEDEGRQAIIAATGMRHVAFIEADEQGGLEHADGVVAFIDDNVLVINQYPEDPDYAEGLKMDLRAGLPNVTIHEIIAPYDGRTIYDDRFGSACGLYTNMLVTPNHIYFPQFGIPEDAEALAQLSRWTEKTIIPIQSHPICQMGGGVRCMSWQLRGESARKLLQAAQTD